MGFYIFLWAINTVNILASQTYVKKFGSYHEDIEWLEIDGWYCGFF